MSFLTRTLPRSFVLPRSSPLTLTQASQGFHTTVLRAALSESDHHREDDERQAEIDRHKHDQLNKQKEGKGHWKGELASNSEAAVKADRGEIHDAQEDTARLQKETMEHMERERKGEK